jgi:hypothetical protein
MKQIKITYNNNKKLRSFNLKELLLFKVPDGIELEVDNSGSISKLIINLSDDTDMICNGGENG